MLDSTSALFSGKEYIQYELKDSSIGSSTGSTGRVSRRQLDPLQSFIELEISVSFRTKIKSGTILEMTGPPQNDFAIIQVTAMIVLSNTVFKFFSHRSLKMVSSSHSILVVETTLLVFMMILLKTLSINSQLSY